MAAYYLYSYGAKIGGVLGNKENYGAAYGAAGGTLGTNLGALSAYSDCCFLYTVRCLNGRCAENAERERKRIRIFSGRFFFNFTVFLSTTIYNISSILDQGVFKNIVLLQGYAEDQMDTWWGIYTGEYKLLINVPISIASRHGSILYSESDRCVCK